MPNDTEPADVLDSDNLANVRKFGREQEKARKAAETRAGELEERLAAIEAEAAKGQALTAAKAAGLSDDQYAQLLKLNPNPDQDAIATFAAVVVRQDDTDMDAPTAPSSGSTFVPVSGDASPAKAFTTADFIAALGDDAKIQRMAEQVARDPSRLQLKHPEAQER